MAVKGEGQWMHEERGNRCTNFRLCCGPQQFIQHNFNRPVVIGRCWEQLGNPEGGGTEDPTDLVKKNLFVRMGSKKPFKVSKKTFLLARGACEVGWLVGWLVG